ncbi:MAG: epoxide hydrolase N-terminal domain-containing protein, partial [Blastocatellia bacterium]
MMINPFTIVIPQSTLDDLQDRLTRTRWPGADADSGWGYGTSLSYLHDLVDYWQHSYDWRTHEARINKFAQFTADIDGVRIHFIHERGGGTNPTPILLT